MSMDFLATVNKTSGTPFNPAGSTGTAAPGFRDQIDRAMRDNDRKNEYNVEKKPAEQKKPLAAGQKQGSAKADGKSAAPSKEAGSAGKYVNDETGAAGTAERAEVTSETTGANFELDGDDSGFHVELKEAETSETENTFTFASTTDETHAPAVLDDSSVSSSTSTDAQFFPAELINDVSGLDFAALMNMQESVENADSAANPNVVQNADTGEAPVAATEVILQMVAGMASSTQAAETVNANIQQNVSLSGSGASVDEAELTNTESARPAGKEVLENELFQRNLAAAQNSDRNSAASLRSETARAEISQEARNAANADTSDSSNQSDARASSKDEALLLERMAAQALRPRESVAFANVSETAGKTIQVAEVSIQAMSATAKAEAPVPARSVDVPDKDFIVELAGRIQAQIRGGREMIRIQLHPEELGRLEIRAESGRNGIVARIAAESLDVKRLLESNIQSLQQALESRGLKIDRLHIVVEDSAYAGFADGGRYGNAGAGPRNPEVSEFSSSSAGIEAPEEDDPNDLSAEAEQRGVGFYTVG